jgi:Fe-S cluster assembly protein SufD
MSIVAATAAEVRPYLEAFRAAAAEPLWLGAERRESLRQFAEAGFPSRRSEAWRYLDLRMLAEAPLLPANHAPIGVAAARALLDETGGSDAPHRLILVDGRVVPELSAVADLPEGVWLGSMTQALAARPELARCAFAGGAYDRDEPFAALNGAFFTDGFVLEATPSRIVEQPIEIVHLASGEFVGSWHTRSHVSLGDRSRIRLYERHVGKGRYWRNDVLTARLEGGAAFERAALVEEAEDATHLAVLVAEIGARARLESCTLILGGRTVRCETHATSAGEGAYCGLHGGFVAAGRTEANIVTTVDHAARCGETREIFKGVAAGRGHGAFQGRIRVRPGAQKIDAHMLSRNLVLGARAAIDTKPELEILADDVKCSHGAAVGDLDEEALFYLMARGIGRQEARRMLVEAFVREAVETIAPGPLRDSLLTGLARRIAALEDEA